MSIHSKFEANLVNISEHILIWDVLPGPGGDRVGIFLTEFLISNWHSCQWSTNLSHQ